MPKNLFIDCGAHLGEAYEHFSQVYPPAEYDYVLFEPNPNCFAKLQERYGSQGHMTLRNNAVYTHDNETSFFSDASRYTENVSEDDGFSVGCSIIQEHNNKHYEPAAVERVQCVDAVRLLSDVSDKYRDIVLKLDVEGSEYDILERLIAAGSMPRIKKLIVEFHSQYSSSADMRAREERLVEQLRAMSGLDLQIWH